MHDVPDAARGGGRRIIGRCRRADRAAARTFAGERIRACSALARAPPRGMAAALRKSRGTLNAVQRAGAELVQLEWLLHSSRKVRTDRPSPHGRRRPRAVYRRGVCRRRCHWPSGRARSSRRRTRRLRAMTGLPTTACSGHRLARSRPRPTAGSRLCRSRRLRRLALPTGGLPSLTPIGGRARSRRQRTRARSRRSPTRRCSRSSRRRARRSRRSPRRSASSPGARRAWCGGSGGSVRGMRCRRRGRHQGCRGCRRWREVRRPFRPA